MQRSKVAQASQSHFLGGSRAGFLVFVHAQCVAIGVAVCRARVLRIIGVFSGTLERQTLHAY